MAAVVNMNMNNLLNGKDSRWLQLEVCREFQRNKCSRPDTECKFAHPPANVEVQNGRVTACYDSIKVSAKGDFGVIIIILRSTDGSPPGVCDVRGCREGGIDGDLLSRP